MAKDKKKPQAAGDPGGRIALADIADKLTINGRPVFDDIKIDPDTGDLLSYTLQPEIKEELEAQAAAAAGIGVEAAQRLTTLINGIIGGADNKQIAETLQEWHAMLKAVSNDAEAGQALLEELRELRPFLDAELKRADYSAKDFNDIAHRYTLGELLDKLNDPASNFSQIMDAARAAKRSQAMRRGREQRQQEKKNAEAAGAIMAIKGGNYPVFSKTELWDAFAPTRIFEMGKIDPNSIDPNTGELLGYLQEGDIKPLEVDEISFKAFMLLNSIMGNSVDNVRQDFIENGGQIEFYVKGVLQSMDIDDPRILTDNQLNMDRKTAGAIYLENLFKPLENYIGTTENGSRWSVFKYIGYDALKDTMIIITPYIYQLWRQTQEDYFNRQQRKIEAQADGKKPKKDDLKPLEINNYFKGRAYSENEIILEIAIYITNVLLTAGSKKGQLKKTKISYKKLIQNCPHFEKRLQEIDARPNQEIIKEDDKERIRNNTAIYNSELRKIKRAFDLILDPEKCDALNYYEFIDIQPAKVNKAGKVEFIAPTKKKLDEYIYIEWRRIADEN